MLLVAIYVFINKYELRRIGKDRKKYSKRVVLWKKIRFVKYGEIFQYEDEYESTFSNGSTSLAEVLSSNTKSKLARLP